MDPIEAIKAFLTFKKTTRYLILGVGFGVLAGVFLPNFIPSKYTSMLGYKVMENDEYKKAQDLWLENQKLTEKLQSAEEKYQKLVGSNCSFFINQAKKAQADIDVGKDVLHMATLNNQENSRSLADNNLKEASSRYQSIINKIEPCFGK
jgi:hypothetical protein